MGPERARMVQTQLEFSPEDVRRELKRVGGSAAFRGSHRCRAFLEFVVAKALDGDAESLKERTVAVGVFGRDAAADLGDDSIVRVAAHEVRKRLVQYYLDEGEAGPVRIELPAGAYVPVFHSTSLGASPLPERLAEAEPLGTVPRPARPWRRWAVAAVLLAAVAALAAWRWLAVPAGDFDAFWRPAMEQEAPVVLALAHPLVYHPSTRANLLDESQTGATGPPQQRVLNVRPELLDGSDFVPVFDQYVGFGDTVAALRLATLFGQRSHPVRVKLASKLDFADLRDSATVLIGAFTNRWTMELSQNFRYKLAFNEFRKPCIIDTQTGKRQWSPDKADDGSSHEDYIVICRMPRSPTGRFIVIGAGFMQHGTQEAGRILADPEALTPLLKRLPAGWRDRNIELVLHSQVVGDAPTLPELVGSHVW